MQTYKSMSHAPALLKELRRFEREGWKNYPESNYSFNGSIIQSYEDEFRPLMAPGSIVGLVGNIQRPTVIDLMAPPQTVMSLFEHVQDVGRLGISVRYSAEPWTKQHDDCNVTEIGGDLVLGRTWRGIKDALKGRKADLIMERGRAGFYSVPTSRDFYAVMLNRAWSLLEPNGGTLLLESPQLASFECGMPSKKDIIGWIGLLQENGINVKSDPVPPNNTRSIWLLKLTRKPSDPQKLPFSSQT